MCSTASRGLEVRSLNKGYGLGAKLGSDITIGYIQALTLNLGQIRVWPCREKDDDCDIFEVAVYDSSSRSAVHQKPLSRVSMASHLGALTAKMEGACVHAAHSFLAHFLLFTRQIFDRLSSSLFFSCYCGWTPNPSRTLSVTLNMNFICLLSHTFHWVNQTILVV